MMCASCLHLFEIFFFFLVQKYLGSLYLDEFHEYPFLFNLRWVEIFQGNMGILIF